MPQEEHPPIGKTFVQSYDQGDQDYPILAISMDPRAPGYATPSDYAAHPDATNWPNHIFYDVRRTSSDQRVLWLYCILPGASVTASYYDAETNTFVQETRQRVRSSTADPTPGDLFTAFHREPESDTVDLFVTRTYPSGVVDKTFTEYEPDHYTYPALLHSVAISTLYNLQGEAFTKVNPLIEAERPLLIAKKIVRTFTTTAPTDANLLSGIYPIQTVRNRYAGYFFVFPTGPVLQNSGSIVFNTASDDPVWGPVTETYAYGDSVPTRSAYVASRSAGEWKVVYKTSKKLANSLYMLISTSIPIL